jgi:electron transfer flavoprotein beta subunit
VRIFVCVKQVPDTEARLTALSDGVSIDERDITFIMSPYDEYAVEEAVRLKEASASPVSITVITVGPARADDVLRLGLAMGADSALRVWEPSLEGADGATVATLLAAAAHEIGFDLVLCGRVAIDDAMGEVPLRLAAKLGIPHANAVTKVALEGNRLHAHAEVEGGTDIVEMDLPALVTTQRGLNEPRYPSIHAIMKARRMPIELRSPESLGVDAAVLTSGCHTKLVRLTESPIGRVGRLIQADTPEQAARELALLLRDEAKVL